MRPFHLLIKPTGAACNLRCRYCFFLEKAALYPGSTFRMSDEVMEACIAQTLAAHPGPEVTFAWQGGEPTLMGLPFFERVVAAAERRKAPATRVQHTIQTNGVLLDEEWAAFLARHRFLVGLSIDGPEAVHDAYRHDLGGHGTHARVVRAWELLQRHGADVNLLCTVHAASVPHPLDVYRFFRDALGARFLQFIPVVEREPRLAVPAAGPASGAVRLPAAGDSVTARSVRPGEYGRFLSAVFDEWVARDVGTVFVQSFDAALANWVGRPSICVFSPTCGSVPALEHNGDLYACDHFVEPGYLLGNILEEPLGALLDAPRLRAFGDAKARTLPAPCRTCDVRFACEGECPRNRFVADRVGGEPLNYLCADYKHFFHHVARPMAAMASLLSRGRPPSEVMTHAAADHRDLAARLGRAGRNDPCPCGSGLKTKKCHAGGRS